MNCKVCLTTYIYGDKYQDYIPLLVYSIHKAYPDYYIILFLHGRLRCDIDKQLRDNDLYYNLEFKEQTFADCSNMNPLKSKSLRWVLWDEKFLDFDYLYIVDIDMLYIKESQSLHEQHIDHLKFIDLPFSNIRRSHQLKTLNIPSIAQRIKHAKLRKILLFLFANNKTIYRASGLHFISIKEYYSEMTINRINYYKHIIYSGKMFDFVLYPNNEAFLYWMLKNTGFEVEKMGTQSDSVQMLDFNIPERKEFRPHHGVHLGIFRTDIDLFSEDTKAILNSSTYSYYINIFKDEIMPDPQFIKLAESFNVNLKLYFERLYQYYSIEG